ncbi:hypothetical protein [Sphingomonas koreensis]
MGEIFAKASEVYRDRVMDGVLASPLHEPEKVDIRELFKVVDVATYAAQTGIRIVANTAARDAWFADNPATLVYVNNNNGEPDDPANGVYEFVDAAPRIAESFYASLATVVQPLVDEANAAKVAAANSAHRVSPMSPDSAPAAVTDNVLWARGYGIDRTKFYYFRALAFTGLAGFLRVQIRQADDNVGTNAIDFAGLTLNPGTGLTGEKTLFIPGSSGKGFDIRFDFNAGGAWAGSIFDGGTFATLGLSQGTFANTEGQDGDINRLARAQSHEIAAMGSKVFEDYVRVEAPLKALKRIAVFNDDLGREWDVMSILRSGTTLKIVVGHIDDDGQVATSEVTVSDGGGLANDEIPPVLKSLPGVLDGGGLLVRSGIYFVVEGDWAQLPLSVVTSNYGAGVLRIHPDNIWSNARLDGLVGKSGPGKVLRVDDGLSDAEPLAPNYGFELLADALDSAFDSLPAGTGDNQFNAQGIHPLEQTTFRVSAPRHAEVGHFIIPDFARLYLGSARLTNDGLDAEPVINFARSGVFDGGHVHALEGYADHGDDFMRTGVVSAIGSPIQNNYIRNERRYSWLSCAPGNIATVYGGGYNSGDRRYFLGRRYDHHNASREPFNVLNHNNPGATEIAELRHDLERSTKGWGVDYLHQTLNPQPHRDRLTFLGSDFRSVRLNCGIADGNAAMPEYAADRLAADVYTDGGTLVEFIDPKMIVLKSATALTGNGVALLFGKMTGGIGELLVLGASKWSMGKRIQAALDADVVPTITQGASTWTADDGHNYAPDSNATVLAAMAAAGVVLTEERLDRYLYEGRRRRYLNNTGATIPAKTFVKLTDFHTIAAAGADDVVAGWTLFPIFAGESGLVVIDREWSAHYMPGAVGNSWFGITGGAFDFAAVGSARRGQVIGPINAGAERWPIIRLF